MDVGLIQRMMDVISHRGPDGEGKYVRGNVGLGHRRLSIIDLNTGAQPISNEDGTVWIVFNGEIYNYQELRKDLLGKGHAFKTSGDTETIIHLYEEYGVECLNKLRGMFGFAIWDQRLRRLFIARDRVGIKPLYYCNTGKALLFGSELKSILADSEVKREVNLPAVGRFLAHFYLPGEDTLLCGIRKLLPGHYLLVDSQGRVSTKEYWDLNFHPNSNFKTIEDASASLAALLQESVKLHMISDVPVGFLLSGGVDSTGLLSYAVDQTDKEIQTFTIGFEGENFADERPFAKLAANHFGTTHHEITMTAKDFRDFLPRYVWHMEEPVCEPPAIALYYVSKLARSHVKVLLSGEGGDEAFGGYPEYRNYSALEFIKSGMGRCRKPMSRALGAFGRLSGSSRASKYAPLLTTPLSEYYLSRTSSPFYGFNKCKRSLYTSEFLKQAGNGYSTAVTRDLFARVNEKDLLSQMLYVDTKTWLPDDLLVKADKMTMANSLELRVPLLDHKVLEFAATLPSDFKVRGTSTKRILKRAISGGIPREIVTRKKAGFPVPYGNWLKGELRDYTMDMLTSRSSIARGFFETKSIERIFESDNPDTSYAKEAFSLLVLELWLQEFLDSNPARFSSNMVVPQAEFGK